MKFRTLGKTNYKISEIGLGTWSFGADWGVVSDKDALQTMQTAVEQGVNFFDTADVYGDGRSEQLIGKFLQKTKKRIYVATKLGRRVRPHVASEFTTDKLEPFINRSLKNLRLETLDLVQLHCPPTQVYYMPEIFNEMDRLVKSGKVRFYGVSVEKIEEGLKAMEYPGVATIQVIYNMFRQRPHEVLFEQAKRKNVGIIVRVPLASGLLSGKISKTRTFPKNDHRNYNRHGEAFDQGETFAGVDFSTGLKAVEKLKKVFGSKPLAQMALCWILMQDAVSTVIPGAKNPEQANANVQASALPRLTMQEMREVKKIYDSDIKPLVHQQW